MKGQVLRRDFACALLREAGLDHLAKLLDSGSLTESIVERALASFDAALGRQRIQIIRARDGALSRIRALRQRSDLSASRLDQDYNGA